MLTRQVALRVLLSAIAVGCPSPAMAGEAETIEQRLLDGISFLASDELKGRRVGTPEIDQAADYIRREFAAAGLQTNIYDDGPFQTVKLSGQMRIGQPQDNTLRFYLGDGRDKTINGRLDQDFRPLAIGGSKPVDAPLVFAGYGITAPEYEFDDYGNMEVKDKAVVILRKEPQQNDPNSVFNGKANTRHAFFRVKVENAIAHGAAAVILVNDRNEIQKRRSSLRRKWQRAMRQLGSEQDKLDEHEWDDVQFEQHRERVSRAVGTLADLEPQWSQADRVLEVSGAGGKPVDASVPVLYCRRELVDRMLLTMETSLNDLQDRLDNMTACSCPLDGWSVQASTQLDEVQGRNVIGVLDGEGEIADETVIIGAHYDHVGMGGMGSLAPWTRAVHNGADDNASGVIALLEIARRLAANPPAPRRRIAFIAFTGEEMGLLGSKQYVRAPRYPLSKTVAMLNLDMVGRLGDRPLTIQGVDTALEFSTWVDSAAGQHELAIRRKRGGVGPSDHASFFREDIPVLHFFTGIHRDYHRPSDDVEKIDLSGLRRVTAFVTQVSREIAKSQKRPAFGKTEDEDEG